MGGATADTIAWAEKLLASLVTLPALPDFPDIVRALAYKARRDPSFNAKHNAVRRIYLETVADLEVVAGLEDTGVKWIPLLDNSTRSELLKRGEELADEPLCRLGIGPGGGLHHQVRDKLITKDENLSVCTDVG